MFEENNFIVNQIQGVFTQVLRFFAAVMISYPPPRLRKVERKFDIVLVYLGLGDGNLPAALPLLALATFSSQQVSTRHEAVTSRKRKSAASSSLHD
jgi:hypothetical protein